MLVENQTKLDQILSYTITGLNDELHKLGQNIEINLSDKTFVFDCTSNLITSLENMSNDVTINIIFKGLENTTIILINPKKESYLYKKNYTIFCKHTNIFSNTSNIIFKNLSLKSLNYIEIIFKNKDSLSKWNNVNFDDTKIKTLLLDEVLNELLKNHEFIIHHILDRAFRTTKRPYDKNSYKHLDLGDHLVVFRSLYTHHGIYVGNNKVINYSGSPTNLLKGEIIEISLKEFVGDDLFCVQVHEDAFPADTIVKRAKMCLREHNYNLITNNCEHFANWCCTGKHKSKQVDSMISISGTIIAQLFNILKFL